MKAVVRAWALLAALAWKVGAQDAILPPQERISGRDISGLFDRAFPDWQRPVVRILHPGTGEQVALGVIVDAERRLVVTKSSEVPHGEARCRQPGVGTASLKRLGVDRRNDLAVFTLSGTNALSAAEWAPETPAWGAWIFCATGEAVRPVRIGVVSAKRRAISRSEGVLGIVMGGDMKDAGGVLVAEVIRGAGAARGGVRAGDVITAINDEAVPDADGLRRALSGHDPGAEVDLKIVREGQGMVLKVTLGNRSVVFAMFNRNQSISGPVSKVASGFPDVFQHATKISATAMGGPVFDLEGRVAGISIARVNRSENLALPAEAVRKAVAAVLRQAEGADGAKDIR